MSIKYVVRSTNTGYAVAIAKNAETVGEFKRLQRILNDLLVDKVAVDGQIGPITARSAMKLIKTVSTPFDVPSWDLVTTDQVNYVAANVVQISTALASTVNKGVDDYSNAPAPRIVRYLSPVIYTYLVRQSMEE